MYDLKTLISIIVLLLSNGILFSQQRDTAVCFQLSFDGAEEHVFTKMEILPSYAGGEDKLFQRLFTSMDLDKIVNFKRPNVVILAF